MPRSLAATGKILYSIQISVGIFIYVESSDCELVGFKNADLAISFQMRSAFVSWCISRQPIFSVVHRREVSGVKSRNCWILLVGKIALRLRNWKQWFLTRVCCVDLSVQWCCPCTKTCIHRKANGLLYVLRVLNIKSMNWERLVYVTCFFFSFIFFTRYLSPCGCMQFIYYIRQWLGEWDPCGICYVRIFFGYSNSGWSLPLALFCTNVWFSAVYLFMPPQF